MEQLEVERKSHPDMVGNGPVIGRPIARIASISFVVLRYQRMMMIKNQTVGLRVPGSCPCRPVRFVTHTRLYGFFAAESYRNDGEDPMHYLL